MNNLLGSNMHENNLKPGDIICIKRTGTWKDFWHWAVYVSDDEVIHYTSLESDNASDNQIMVTDIRHFLRKQPVYHVVNFPSHYEGKKVLEARAATSTSSFVSHKPGFNVLKLFIPGAVLAMTGAASAYASINSSKYKIAGPDEVIKRARSRIGERKYSVLTNNCEHFAVWCKTGLQESEQAAFWKKLHQLNKIIDGRLQDTALPPGIYL